MNFKDEMKIKFSEERSDSAIKFKTYRKVENAEDEFLDTLNDEQKSLYFKFRDIELERDSIEVDEALEFAFDYVISLCQTILGIDRKNKS